LFYEEVLRGRQVWETDGPSADAALWFLVGTTLVEVCTVPGDERPPITLVVDEPDDCAARCWDAGFSVRVYDDANGRAVLSVVDPFGRRIVLARREPRRAVSQRRRDESPNSRGHVTPPVSVSS
jgi:catechol 2,3-dioxygenase-like lactoylglutathione lyase family enzyme